MHEQTILAYDLNDAPLPVPNGAPIRLRVERQLGYKHAKYVTGIEFVASFAQDRRRQGRLLGGPGLPVVRGDLTPVRTASPRRRRSRSGRQPRFAACDARAAQDALLAAE